MEIKIENESVNRNGRASTIRLPHCRQFRHYLATKSHLWWVHLLCTNNKLVNTLNNLQHRFFIWWRLRSFCFCLLIQPYPCLSKTLLFLSKVANSFNKLFNIFSYCAWNFAWNLLLSIFITHLSLVLLRAKTIKTRTSVYFGQTTKFVFGCNAVNHSSSDFFVAAVKTFVTLTEILNVLFPLLTSIYNGLDYKKSSAHR